MADSKADAARVRVEFGNFLADLGRRVASADGAIDAAAALTIAEQALGGGRRATALLHGFAVLLAYADSKPGATVLDDEEGANRAAHDAVLRQLRAAGRRAGRLHATPAGRPQRNLDGAGPTPVRGK